MADPPQRRSSNQRSDESPVVTISRRELFELGAAVGAALLAGGEGTAQAADAPAPLPGSDGTANELLRW